jgi:hypothetical protein
MLIDHLDVILCAGRLTSENRATILAAANTPSLNLTGIDKVKYVAGLIALIRGQTPLCLSGISGGSRRQTDNFMVSRYYEALSAVSLPQ